MKPLRSMQQSSAYESPWSVGTRIKLVLWMIISTVLFRTSPKPLIAWRNWLLKCFGAQIIGRPFVSNSAEIKFPWKLTLHHRACLGPRCVVYNLGRITLHEAATVAQEVYLCSGTHDFNQPTVPLMTGEIVIGAGAFVGVRALVLPGVEIGEGAIVGGGAVVPKDVEPWTIVAGNPAKILRRRDPLSFTAAADVAADT